MPGVAPASQRRSSFQRRASVPDPQAQGGSRWINFEITVPPAIAQYLTQLGVKPNHGVNILATVDTRATVDKNGQTKNHRVYIARFIEPVRKRRRNSKMVSRPRFYNNGAPVQNYVNNGQPPQQPAGFTGAAAFDTAMY